MPNKRIDDNKAFNGFMWGVIVGGVVTFFNGPRILRGQAGGDSKMQRSLEESIQEGKAAARKRKQQLQSKS